MFIIMLGTDTQNTPGPQTEAYHTIYFKILWEFGPILSILKFRLVLKMPWIIVLFGLLSMCYFLLQCMFLKDLNLDFHCLLWLYSTLLNVLFLRVAALKHYSNFASNPTSQICLKNVRQNVFINSWFC